MSRAGQRHITVPEPGACDVDGDISGQRHIGGGFEAACDVDRAIATLATRQDGVVARPQLGALGLRAAAIDHRIRTGRLIVLHRGVYAVGHTALSDRSRAQAALLAAGPAAVLSHRTAAFAWGLIPSMPPFVELTLRSGRRRSRPGLVIHTTIHPPPTRTRHGLLLTAPLRTLVDLAAEHDRDRLCSEALVLRLVSERELERARLLTADVAPTRRELERRFLALIAQAGLPRPLVNHPIGPYEVDFLWPEQQLVVETDGYNTHGHRAAFERDRARDAELAARGYTVLRFTWRQLRDEPIRVAARLARALSRRSPLPRERAAA